MPQPQPLDAVPVPSPEKWEGCVRKGIRRKTSAKLFTKTFINTWFNFLKVLPYHVLLSLIRKFFRVNISLACAMTSHGDNAFHSGPGRLAVINGTMNSAVYQKILKENVRPSVCDLNLKRTWVLQQDNVPKHTSKSTSEWLKKNKMKTLEWPSQSPDLNPIEMLWHDLKKVVHARKPSNVAEIQQFCKDEWAKIPPQRCNRLIASYRKRLIAVVAAKGGPTSY
ncbi:hypothetical protein QTP86_002767 [Hemibagrus guttatus]|nr:hypothetical protein QTP86_002767 [Hemibagrus guttatus]